MNSDKACVDALTLPITHDDLQRYHNFSGRIPQVLHPDLEQRNYNGKLDRRFFSNKISILLPEKKS